MVAALKKIQIVFLLFAFSFQQMAYALPMGTPPRSPVVSFNFDWDDNVIHMPTKNLLFHRETGESIAISNTELALHRVDIANGVGKYKDYTIRKVDPTHVEVFHNFSGETKHIPLEEWADIRKIFKNKGTPTWQMTPADHLWADYSLKETIPDSSFHFVRSIHVDNFFLKDLQTAIDTAAKETLPAKLYKEFAEDMKKGNLRKAFPIKYKLLIDRIKEGKMSWQGPSWQAFTETMKFPEIAAQTTIITARGQLNTDIHEGLEWLRSIGLIDNIPDLANIHAVGRTENPSAAKVVAMRSLLDEIEAIQLPENAKKVISRDGKSEEVLHHWNFSDDDLGNYNKAVEALQEDVRKGKYKNIKIAIFYTGKHTKENPPPVVIMPNGDTRPMQLAEFAEVPKMLPARLDCPKMFEFLVAHPIFQ